MATSYIFKRIEKKYLLNQERYDLLMQTINENMTLDEYGLTRVCNIYCDTDDFELIRRSIDKPVYKEKLRLRTYGIPQGGEDRCFLELKKKYKGIVYKRRIKTTLANAMEYLNSGIKIVPKNGKNIERDLQILKEIDEFIQYHNTSPKVYISYDRMAYYGNEDVNFRVTFDMNIRSRFTDLDLRHGDYGDALIDKPYYLMEVKTAGGIPLWMAHKLSELKIYPQSFSKYGRIYEQNFRQLMAAK
ncbi:MAG: polyphosphate polymerase domain-containing protein [Eubacterium sp.]